MTPDNRVTLKNGYTLQITNAVPQDAGDYICQIATLEPREITHHVEILGKCKNEKVIILIRVTLISHIQTHTYSATTHSSCLTGWSYPS